ncbi:hypothetical protein [Streptomyces sp. NPDC048527]|uniref:hypothetical protein n=1 Tax=Streptomyces sp. NPDC048527 TaxID=3365568 RepID=UPI0037177393
MRRASIRGRRGALTGATAAVVCLGGLLAACGSSGGGDGYVAVGAAGATPERTPGRTVAPTGDVELVPLDGAASDPPATAGSGTPGSGGIDGGGGGGDKSPGGGGSSGNTGDAGGTQTPAGSGSGAPEGSGTDGSGQPSTSTGGSGSGATTPSAPGTGTPSTPSGPAVLKTGDPERKATDKRWCEDVTLNMVNTGGSAVRSGTVTFGTHIIGALGIDWATVESTQDLPVPIDAGKRKKKTWTVCVDAWRVPLGMHVETRDVSVEWK